MAIYVCEVCGFEYDVNREGVPVAELPAEWTCPVCESPKSVYSARDESAPEGGTQTSE